VTSVPVIVEEQSGVAGPTVPKARGGLGHRFRPILGFIVPVLLAAAWELAVHFGLSNGRLLPPPSVILRTLADLAVTGELWRHSITTVLRVLAGFGIGVGVGTILGAIAGYSVLTRRLLDPTLQALRAIPSIA
jgi:sulfonate transport system permease protein